MDYQEVMPKRRTVCKMCQKGSSDTYNDKHRSIAIIVLTVAKPDSWLVRVLFAIVICMHLVKNKLN